VLRMRFHRTLEGYHRRSPRRVEPPANRGGPTRPAATVDARRPRQIKLGGVRGPCRRHPKGLRYTTMKPCPFCGMEGAEVHRLPNGGKFNAVCLQGEQYGGDCLAAGPICDTAAEAEAAWDASVLRTEVQRLRKILQQWKEFAAIDANPRTISIFEATCEALKDS
jgi:hypothetical protein